MLTLAADLYDPDDDEPPAWTMRRQSGLCLRCGRGRATSLGGHCQPCIRETRRVPHRHVGSDAICTGACAEVA